MEYNKVDSKNTVERTKIADGEKIVANPEEQTEMVEKAPNKVIVTSAKKQKKGLLERLVLGILGPDGLPSISKYVGREIVLPALRNMAYDTFVNGARMMIFKDEQDNRPYTPTGTAQYNYGTHYKQPQKYVDQKPAPRSVNRQHHVSVQVDDYVITDRTEAYQVIETLRYSADNYGRVSLADYYEQIGVKPVDVPYTAHNVGWDSEGIRHVQLVGARGGFIIKFPPLQAI